jgi:hypothetical protein
VPTNLIGLPPRSLPHRIGALSLGPLGQLNLELLNLILIELQSLPVALLALLPVLPQTILILRPFVFQFGSGFAELLFEAADL